MKGIDFAMNKVVKQLINETIDWHIPTWKLFRSKNDYWRIKDTTYKKMNKHIEQGERYKAEDLEYRFKKWKLERIKEFKNEIEY